MRSKFCGKYPERCETPANKTGFCNAHPHYSYYCRTDIEWENFTVPKKEFYGYEKTASLKELKELSHDQYSLFGPSRSALYKIQRDIEGPLTFFKNNGRYFSCYIIHFRANSSKDARTLIPDPLHSFRPVLEVDIYFEPYETFFPGRRPGGYLAIHSPFEFLSPSEFGYPISPEKFCNVHISIEEEKLLPYPYKSDCTNYSQMWLDNGRKGSRSQQMCRLTCLFHISMKYCNCSVKYFPYPYDENICLSEPKCNTSEEASWEFHECVESCKSDCEKTKFLYSIQQREVEEIEWKRDEDKEQHKTYLSIYLSNPEVVVFKHRPHYETVEVFSYIGGYIGAWLGISLVAVADFMECMLLTINFAFQEKKQKKVPAVEYKSP